jgi:hypothetical protein
MIVEFVQFKYPPGLTREQILDDARTTIPRWRGNTELISKHYIAGDDGLAARFTSGRRKKPPSAVTMPNGSPTSRRAPARCPPSATSIS